MLRRILLVLIALVVVIVLAAIAAVLLIDPDDYREQIAERASEQVGREVRLDGPMSLRLFPWLAFEIRDASVGNPPDFETAPKLAEIGLARAAVRVWPLVRGEVEVGAINFEDATFTLVTDRRGRSNLDGLFAADPGAADPGEPDLSALQTGAVGLRSVSLVLLDLGTGSRQEVAVESFDMASFAADRDIDIALRGRIEIDGERVLDDLRFDGRMNVASNLARVALESWQLRANLPELEAAIGAEGDALVDLSGEFVGVDLARFDVRLDLAEMTVGLALTETLALVLDEPVRASMPGAELRIDDQRLALNGELSLGDPISGRLEISGERLDLRDLAALSGDDEATADGELPDFSPLALFDFRADLDLGALILADGIQLTEVRAGSHLTGGVLQLEPLDARLFGGRFEGRAEVDFNEVPPAVHLQPRLSGVLVEQIAAVFSEHAPVAGSGDLSLDLRFRGLDVSDILASLDGSGNFTLSDGALRGIDLDRLIEQELTVASLGNVRQAFSGQTPFRTLAGSLRAEDGVISMPDLDLAASGFGARGSGRIDFAADQVDYRVDLELGESLLERLPSRLRSATGGRIPLAIAGPMTAPVVTVDLAGIAERAVRDEVGRRLFDRLDRPRTDDAPQEDGEEGVDEEQESRAEEDPERGSERTGRQLLRGLIDARERRSEEDETESADDEEDVEEEENDNASDSDSESTFVKTAVR